MNCSVIHWATWVFSIEIARATILLFFREFWIFFWFLLYHNFVSEILIPFIWRKPVSCRRVTIPAFTHAVIVSPWPSWLGHACGPFTDTDRIWCCRSDRNVPFHLTKLFSPGPLICILLTTCTGTITQLWFGLCNCNTPFISHVDFPKF